MFAKSSEAEIAGSGGWDRTTRCAPQARLERRGGPARRSDPPGGFLRQLFLSGSQWGEDRDQCPGVKPLGDSGCRSGHFLASPASRASQSGG